MRHLDVAAWLSEAVGPFVVLFALVTQLGDLWFLGSLALGGYWLGPHVPRVGAALTRNRTAVVVALLFGLVALTTTLKPLFGLPRPPGATVPPRPDVVPAVLEPLYASMSTGSGYGFPSGHALGSTIMYGGLAWAVRIGDRRQRVALATVLVVVVSLSRLVLGVHYLVDVVAGVAIGLVFLGVVFALGSPRRAFGLAAAVALLGIGAVGLHGELAGAAGLCVGGVLAWALWGDRLLDAPSRRGAAVTVVLGVLTAAPLLALVAREVLPSWASLVVGFVGGVVVVALPLVGERVVKKDSGGVGV